MRPHRKNDSETEIKNYRPIAMLCAISIAFERIVYKQIKKTFERKLCTAQHGFRQKHSTVTQLLLYGDNLYQALDDNPSPITVYFKSSIVLGLMKSFEIYCFISGWSTAEGKNCRQLLDFLKNLKRGSPGINICCVFVLRVHKWPTWST